MLIERRYKVFGLGQSDADFWRLANTNFSWITSHETRELTGKKDFLAHSV